MKGIVIEIDGKQMIVLTPEGDFYKVTSQKDAQVGQVVEFKMPRPIFFEAKFVAIAAVLIVFIGVATIIAPLLKSNSTIMIDSVVPLGVPNVQGETRLECPLEGDNKVSIILTEDTREFEWEATCAISAIYIQTQEGNFVVDTANAQKGISFVGPGATAGETAVILKLSFTPSEEEEPNPQIITPSLEAYRQIEKGDFPEAYSIEVNATLP